LQFKSSPQFSRHERTFSSEDSAAEARTAAPRRRAEV
jgi:hypothetical protein